VYDLEKLTTGNGFSILGARYHEPMHGTLYMSDRNLFCRRCGAQRYCPENGQQEIVSPHQYLVLP
jgi:hypothetical protein